jgi:glycosyltransferase involved in cell wall biosynthesis
MVTIAEIELFTPDNDVDDPEISIVIPAVNEELTISDFVAWCQEGIARAGVRGEILIVDSSTDRTRERALAGGARVLATPKRGLGRAYIDAVPHIRGRYVIMGDADCTYDFREIEPFVEALRGGAEFVMGSRFRGSIEPGSMPALHRYFGTPLTTWILNRVYGSHFTDIHCGMRGISRDALERMGLASQSWEYASEMVLKSVRMSLPTVEVPVKFYKDRDGRMSHHKRSGWFSPFAAAWINLRAMAIYKGEFFALKPGLVLLGIGLVLTLPLTFGPITIGAITFSLYWMLLGTMLSIVGLTSFFFGCLAQMFSDYTGGARARWTRVFRYTEAVITSMVVFLIGLGLCIALAVKYASDNFTLPPPRSVIDHVGITGVLLVMMGFSTFIFTLVVNATSVRYGVRRPDQPSVTRGGETTER